MIYDLADESTTDIEFHKLEILFINIIGKDNLISGLIDNNKIEQILQIFYKFRRQDLLGFTSTVKQLHILYLFAKVLHAYKSQLPEMSDLDFLNDIYYKNIYNTIANFLTDTRKLLSSVNKQVYTVIKDKSNEVTEYYLVFFNNNEFAIQKDCLDIFFTTVFLDNDVLDYDDHELLLNHLLSNVYFTYLKIKTNDHLSFSENDLTDMRVNGPDTFRCRLFEVALREGQIRVLVSSNSNSKKVLNSYYKFKDNLLGNELHKLYRSFSNKQILLPSNKELILNINSNEDEFINRIKLKLPLVYELITALHVEIYSKLNAKAKTYKSLMYKTIYESLYVEFKQFQTDDICKNIATKVSISLCVGYYINPITLNKIDLYNTEFIVELKMFLSEVFDAYQR